MNDFSTSGMLRGVRLKPKWIEKLENNLNIFFRKILTLSLLCAYETWSIKCSTIWLLVYCCFSFMGRGVIEASPLTVWEAVKNPLSRYIYDNMLKVQILSEDRHIPNETLDFTVKCRFVFRRYVLALLLVGLLRKFEAYLVYLSLIWGKIPRRFSCFQKFRRFSYMFPRAN